MLLKKTGISILQIAITFAIAVLLLASTYKIVKAGTTNDEIVTLTGYLIDEHCFANKSDDPGKDTKSCLLMKGCIKGGYGIAVPQTDGSYKFYYFNGKFYTDVEALDGTDNQKLAYDLIVASTKKDHLAVTVTGTLGGVTKASINLKDVSYPVFDVTNLVESTNEEVANIDNIINNANIQDEKDAEKQKAKEGIAIKYIVIILVVFGASAALLSKKIKKAK